ncbi:MAG TPA: hypothetical protein V6D07_12725 [Trichocoleus sp.]
MLLTTDVQRVEQPWLVSLALRLNRPFARFVVVLALVLSLLPLLKAEVSHAAPPVLEPAQKNEAGSVVSQGVPSSPMFPADGIYVYGQAPVAEQLGTGYVVFETVDQQLVGALYLPQSSFDCFQGQLEGNALAMTITNSYTQETYPYEIALASDSAIASSANGIPAPLSLEGFHQLATPSENDLRMLETCKAVLQP